MIFQNCYTKFHEPLGEWNLRQFWNITSGIYSKYHEQIMLLFIYTTTHKGFVIFTCRYFKLSWNTTALSQSNCRNFSCSSIKLRIHFLSTIQNMTRFLGLEDCANLGKNKTRSYNVSSHHSIPHFKHSSRERKRDLW